MLGTKPLDRDAQQCCPVHRTFAQFYHWSLVQVEYATNLVLRSRQTLAPLYEQLSRQSVLAVKAEQVASFLGKKITPQLAQEIGSRFATRYVAFFASGGGFTRVFVLPTRRSLRRSTISCTRCATSACGPLRRPVISFVPCMMT